MAPDEQQPTPPEETSAPPEPRPRRGSVFLVVLGVSLIVAALAYGGILVTRARQRTAAETADAAQARQNAETGIDLARLWIRQDANWRLNRSPGSKAGVTTRWPGW